MFVSNLNIIAGLYVTFIPKHRFSKNYKLSLDVIYNFSPSYVHFENVLSDVSKL